MHYPTKHETGQLNKHVVVWLGSASALARTVAQARRLASLQAMCAGLWVALCGSGLQLAGKRNGTQRSSVCAVRDCGVVSCPPTRKFERATTLEYPLKPLWHIHFVSGLWLIFNLCHVKCYLCLF